ncbi:hypothetical protein GCM10010170_014370 [Dactylosporangium salmoneum]|uniref:Uncharacterized protein n=1 Tax=Dactylosporangium salmoneum TaxID=53361 RepID=A0ABP5SML5_9ACTN
MPQPGAATIVLPDGIARMASSGATVVGSFMTPQGLGGTRRVVGPCAGGYRDASAREEVKQVLD